MNMKSTFFRGALYLASAAASIGACAAGPSSAAAALLLVGTIAVLGAILI